LHQVGKLFHIPYKLQYILGHQRV